MKLPVSHATDGFSLIEVLLSVMIISIFFLITWRFEQYIVNALENTIKSSQSELISRQSLEKKRVFFHVCH